MECCICLEPCLGKTNFLCNHTNFHTSCIDKWIQLSPSCPICRSDIQFSTPKIYVWNHLQIKPAELYKNKHGLNYEIHIRTENTILNSDDIMYHL